MAQFLSVQPVEDDGVDGCLDGDGVLRPGIDAGREVADVCGPPTVSVTDVRLGRHNGFDRMVFDIGGLRRAGWDISYVDEARAAGSGLPIDVDGQAILQVNLRNIALPPDAPVGVEPRDGPDRLALPGTGPIVEVVEDTVYESARLAPASRYRRGRVLASAFRHRPLGRAGDGKWSPGLITTSASTSRSDHTRIRSTASFRQKSASAPEPLRWPGVPPDYGRALSPTCH
jgi:hypothetical protein